MNLRANVGGRGEGRVALARLDRRGSRRSSARRARVTDRDPAWKRGRIRARGRPFSPSNGEGSPREPFEPGRADWMDSGRSVASLRRDGARVLRSPSLTLNIFSLLVSPDPPAGASPRLDARTTAARRARRRDEHRARVGLGRHPCRPDRGARAARGEHATRPLAVAVVVIVVVAAEHADPLSPVCLAPRAVRCTGAVVVGGRSRSARASLLPARRIAVQKQTKPGHLARVFPRIRLARRARFVAFPKISSLADVSSRHLHSKVGQIPR